MLRGLQLREREGKAQPDIDRRKEQWMMTDRKEEKEQSWILMGEDKKDDKMTFKKISDGIRNSPNLVFDFGEDKPR